jgi:hypothetical protein
MRFSDVVTACFCGAVFNFSRRGGVPLFAMKSSIGVSASVVDCCPVLACLGGIECCARDFWGDVTCGSALGWDLWILCLGVRCLTTLLRPW